MQMNPVLFVPLLLIANDYVVSAYVYMHFPPGSNNRLFESSPQRWNPQRMFDSQNPETGGYNIGSIDEDNSGQSSHNRFYYKFFQSSSKFDSKMTIVWDDGGLSESPSIANPTVILQYKCVDLQVENEYVEETHETENYYAQCLARERNLGVFTADQKLSVDSTGYSSETHTRQNSKGIRFNCECPAERDYYPYWHQSPWIDIAFFTRNMSTCRHYKSNSFNTQERHMCLNISSNALRWNNKLTCQLNGGHWLPVHSYKEKTTARTESSCSHNWALAMDADNSTDMSCLISNSAPACIYIGNGKSFTWRLPRFLRPVKKRCLVRVRLNVSSTDYDPSINSSYNHISGRFQCPVRSSTKVQLGGGCSAGLAVDLNISTARNGMVFQDRSHQFLLIPREENMADKIIHNVNVIGKQGHHVSIYPARTMSFHPSVLHVRNGHLVHFQWSGSNLDDKHHSYLDRYDDDPIGRKGRERHNLVEIEDAASNIPVLFEHTRFWNISRVVWPRTLAVTNPYDIALIFASAGYYRNKEEFYGKPKLNPSLDEASASFSGLLLKIDNRQRTMSNQSYHFMCTRNHQFSRVDQKLTIVVIS